MRINIRRPELEAIISERLQSGAYENAEDVIWQALRRSEPSPATADPSEAKNLVELFANSPFAGLNIEAERDKGTGQELLDACSKVRGLFTDEEVDTLFNRTRTSSRPVDFE